ncbi:ribonuclease HI family protein [Candidatus Woesebacteria bacterium]|nr:ribonuclease HI family protein [Candidatus Woesebacteria bacterium]
MIYLIHTDGGSRGNPGQAATGFVIQTDDGSIVFEKGEKIGVTTNNVAEYSAVIAAIKYLLESPTTPIVAKFHLDSKLVVEQINGNYQIKQPHLQSLCMEIQKLRKQLPFPCVFSHVPRKENARADFLVNLALDSS